MASITQGIGQQAQGFSAPATATGIPQETVTSSATGNLLSATGKIASGAFELAEEEVAEGVSEETTRAIAQLSEDVFGNPDDPFLQRTEKRASNLETARGRGTISETRYQLERVRLQKRLTSENPAYADDIRKIFTSAGGNPSDKLAKAMIKEEETRKEQERKNVEADLTFARENSLVQYGPDNRVDEQATLSTVTAVRNQLQNERMFALQSGEAMTDVISGKSPLTSVSPKGAGAIQGSSRNAMADVGRQMTQLTNLYRQALASGGNSDVIDAANNLRQSLSIHLDTLVANKKAEPFINDAGNQVHWNEAHKRYLETQYEWTTSYKTALEAIPKNIDQESLKRLESQNKIIENNLQAGLPIETKKLSVLSKQMGPDIALHLLQQGKGLDETFKKSTDWLSGVSAFTQGEGPTPIVNAENGGNAFTILKNQLTGLKQGYTPTKEEEQEVDDITAASTTVFALALEELGVDPKNTEAASNLIVDKTFQDKMLSTVPKQDQPVVVQEMHKTLMRSAQDMLTDFNNLPNRNNYELTQNPDGTIKFTTMSGVASPSSPFAIAQSGAVGNSAILQANEQRKAQQQANKLNTRLQDIKAFGDVWSPENKDVLWAATQEIMGVPRTPSEDSSLDEALNELLSSVNALNDAELRSVTPEFEGSPEADQIRVAEGGNREASYLDSLGNLTGGVGHLLTEEEKKKYPEGTPIPKEVTEAWFKQDMKEAETDAAEFLEGVPAHPEVKKIITNMSFNLGGAGLKEFKDFKQALIDQDYQKAADEMVDSLWFKQVGNRGKRLVARMRKVN